MFWRLWKYFGFFQNIFLAFYLVQFKQFWFFKLLELLEWTGLVERISKWEFFGGWFFEKWACIKPFGCYAYPFILDLFLDLIDYLVCHNFDSDFAILTERTHLEENCLNRRKYKISLYIRQWRLMIKSVCWIWALIRMPSSQDYWISGEDDLVTKLVRTLYFDWSL